ncbi:MAG TPA: hypothetical protein VFK27_03145, partial [Bacillales bacterium]|nr:hypothetical protein [Bacillales bacterium]
MKGRISKWRNLKDNRPLRIAIYVTLGFMMYLAMISNVMPEKLNVRPFSIASKDILSPVTTVDVEATKQKQNEASAAVPAKYSYKQKASLVQIEKANAIYDAAIKIVQSADQQSEDTGGSGDQKNNGGEAPAASSSADTSGKKTDDKVQALKKALSEDVIDHLSDDTLKTLVTTDASTLNIVKEVTSTTINSVMAKQIKWSELEKAKNSVNDIIPASSLTPQVKQAAIEISKNLIVPNYVLNADKTKQARQEAIESVDPVMIQEGQILAKKGQVINHDIYHQIQVAGLLDDSFNPYPYLGLALLVILLTGFLVYESRDITSKVRSRNTYILMYGMVMFVTLLLMKITSLLEEINLEGMVFLVPAAAGTMLIRLLINERLAITSSLVLAVCAS